MATAINKQTGKHITDIGYADPTYTNNRDWIVNPTKAEIEQYTPIPEPIDQRILLREERIEERKRKLAVDSLISDGVFNEQGELP
jgi:ribosomal protein S16